MILCLCRGVAERVVDAVIADGASSVDDVTDACAAGADCGACHVSILALLGRCAGRARHPEHAGQR